MLASVSQPHALHNLHDLSPLLLLDGDIEENPGPTSSTQTNPDLEGNTLDESHHNAGNFKQEMEIWEKRFTTLQKKTEKKLKKMEAKMKKQEMFNQRLSELCEHEFKKQAKDQSQTQKQIQKLEANFNYFADDTDNRMRINDEQTDKQEQVMKRNNVKIFGVPEKERESYWDCLQSILQLFRESVPGVPWSEKDITKVQRLGAPRNSSRTWYQPRPILVEITTFFDKLMLLKHGREVLRNKGVKISGELTTRQLKTLQDLKEEGHDAYYRNNKLWFRDNRQVTKTPHRATASRRNGGRMRRGATRFSSQRTEGYHHDADNVHFAEERFEEREPPVHYSCRSDQRETDGTWAHPHQPPNRHPHGTLPKSWLRLDEPQRAATSAGYCSGKDAPPEMEYLNEARKVQHDRGSCRTDAWKELRRDFCESDSTESQSDYFDPDDEGTTDLSLPDTDYLGIPCEEIPRSPRRHLTASRPIGSPQRADHGDSRLVVGDGAHP